MLLVELLIGLVGAAIALAWLARHLGLPYPIALVVGGAAIGFVPGLPRLPFDPNLILVLVLPPILYQAALFTSWRDFRANLRPISLLAVGLVIATTVAVAATLKWLVPELPWAVAFAFGAIVSPPDAVAATAIMSRMNVPRRIVTLLEGESLVNDASGLVLYRFAVAAALTGAFSLVAATGQFVLVATGGIVIGTAIARLFVAIHRRVGDTLMEMMLSLMLPYLAYLAAETLHLSGVLAVVAAGLVRGRYAPEAFSPQARIAAYSLWRVVVFAVNCLVFILIGLQLPDLVAGLAGTSLGQAIGYGVLLSIVAMVVRLAWVFPGAYLPRLLRGRVRATGTDSAVAKRRSGRLVRDAGHRFARGGARAAAHAHRRLAVPGTRSPRLPRVRGDLRDAGGAGTHAGAARPGAQGRRRLERARRNDARARRDRAGGAPRARAPRARAGRHARDRRQPA